MSAEVENGKEEDVKEQKLKKPLKKKFMEYWPVGIKVLELLICAICMGFIYDPISSVSFGKIHTHHIGVMYTAYTGYMVINGVLLLSRFLGDKIPYRTISLFAIMGSALFLVTGILFTLDKSDSRNAVSEPNWHLGTMMTTSILFCFLALIIFAIDAVLMFIKRKQF